MARFSWRKWFGFETQLNQRDRLRQRVRPSLEQLESRLAPAITVSAFPLNATEGTSTGTITAATFTNTVQASSGSINDR